MSALGLNPHRARLVTAALLAAPPPNPWVRPVVFPTCTRHVLIGPCKASKFSRPQQASGSSFGKDRSFGSGSSSNSSSENSSYSNNKTTAGRSQKQGDSYGTSGRNKSACNRSSGSSRHDSKPQSDRPSSNSKAQQLQYDQGPKQKTAGPYEGRRHSDGPSSSRNNTSRVVSRAKDVAPPVSRPLPKHAPLLVVGAGAAGLTAAYFAAKQGAQVVVLERTREAGKKVLMSGGTRCNVLPLEADLLIDYFTSSSRSALRAVFSCWSLDECHAWLSRDVGLQMVLEEETRKWFPASNSGREVRDRLVTACQKLGVQFVYNASVEQITPPAAHEPSQSPAKSEGSQQQPTNRSTGRMANTSDSVKGPWRVGLASGGTVTADMLIISTGGYSFPAVGTDGTGLRLLSGLGHKLSDGGCYAALTPLKGPHPAGEQLAGLTLAGVRLSVLKGGTNKVLAAAQRGGLLFTHKGYSGPAVLDVSHWLVKELEQQKAQGQQQQQQQPPRLVVDWTGEGLQVWQERLAGASGASTVNQLLRKHGIKERLANALAAEVGVTNKQLSQLKKSEREHLITALTAWQLPVQGHEGYPKAEVTGGGVPLEQVDCKTMQSRVLPGLYLCGEVLDVFGRIGGFNFWWAWLTGRLAGQAAGAASCTGVSTAAAGAAKSKQR